MDMIAMGHSSHYPMLHLKGPCCPVQYCLVCVMYHPQITRQTGIKGEIIAPYHLTLEKLQNKVLSLVLLLA